jgi:CheY-like chemotaxis protein
MELLWRPTVLVVDRDLGFIVWLSKTFSEAGCDVVPALNCGQALSFVAELKLHVDLIVLDPALTGTSEMILALRKEERTLKIVAIRNRASDAQSTMNADGTLERPSAGEPITQQDWLARVQPILHEVL